ncbi:MAG: hypothetical protein QME96_01125, partial [Myxococcota bacterium]|nr:hypothetical protein [Myxococcota bacterium]
MTGTLARWLVLCLPAAAAAACGTGGSDPQPNGDADGEIEEIGEGGGVEDRGETDGDTPPGQCTAPEHCDDGNECTVDTCNEYGECENVRAPRPGEEGPPGDATCDDDTDNDCDGLTDAEDPNCVSCEADPDCEDGNPCTIDSCDGGACRTTLVEDGTVCDDGLYCTVGQTCRAGACAGGGGRDCSHVASRCNIGSCNEERGCHAVPFGDGMPCDDRLYCTVGDTCSGGTCAGGSSRDCSPAGDACNLGSCDETARACIRTTLPDGAPCDDGRYCTVGDRCMTGVCGGASPRDCSALQDQCNTGACDETGSTCVAVPRPNDTACNDGLRCTTADVCTGGICAGAAVDCSTFTDQCNTGRCDEARGCHGDPLPAATPCNDGRYCTVGETCTTGACGGGSPRDCNDPDPCTTDSCNEGAGQCDNVLTPRPGLESPPGSPVCSDGIDNDCDRLTDAADPDCAGCIRNEDCADGDPCTADVCSARRCANPNAPNGTSCDDGRWCTNPDTCTAGVCGGAPRDCSALGNQCNAGRCDEAGRRCYADPLPNGTSCDDGRWCTNPDTCTAGVCG